MSIAYGIFSVLIITWSLLYCDSRKTSANQVPLGISRATSHAKQIRLAGPRTSPSHRLEEQEKLKSKVFKQVAWKERMFEEKEGKKLAKESEIEEAVVLEKNTVKAIPLAANNCDDEDRAVSPKGKLTSDRRILFRRLLKKKSAEST